MPTSDPKSEAMLRGNSGSSVSRDAWFDLARFTSARIALGRTGGSLPTGPLLDFRVSHARAKDAVNAVFSADALETQLHAGGLSTLALSTQAKDRATYLLRPDLGRKLSPDARAQLSQHVSDWGRRDLAVIVSDGLAAQAAERHASATLVPLAQALSAAGWSLYPIFIVPFARVKLQDEIGALIGARQTLILLGERPGLGTPDSLGAYFTYQPRPDRTDADRNCLSNIRTEGTPPALAAKKLVQLLRESVRIGYSGVSLKEASSPALLPEPNGTISSERQG